MCDCAGICLCLLITGALTYLTHNSCVNYIESEQNMIEKI